MLVKLLPASFESTNFLNFPAPALIVATPFEAVHAAADVISWLGFANYVKHGHECRIDVMEHCDLQVVVDYANSQVVIVGFLDGMEI